MAQSHLPNDHVEQYPGPSQAELGSLADWVSPAEFSQLHHGSRPGRALSTTPIPPAPHYRRPERYSGPTRGELRALDPISSHSASPEPPPIHPDPHPATSIRALESELWVTEYSALATRPALDPARPASDELPVDGSDPFLKQLDEIEAALQKRPRA